MLIIISFYQFSPLFPFPNPTPGSDLFGMDKDADFPEN